MNVIRMRVGLRSASGYAGARRTLGVSGAMSGPLTL